MYFLLEERGQGLTEYAIIIAMIAILLIAALGWIFGALDSSFSQIASSIPH